MRTPILWIGPLAAALAGVLSAWSGLPEAAAWTAAIGTLCALWWVTEPIPLAVTSLIPMALLPLVGVLDATQVAQQYGNKVILLLMGGFLLSTALEKSGAHRRLAVSMVRLCAGGKTDITARRLVMGFMLAAGVLSMGMSNAATTVMMLPIATAAVRREGDPRLATSVLLGIAYAASIGGVATPIGTPPNLICIEEYAKLTGEEINFLDWMGWGLPVALTMLPLTALWLTRKLGRPADLDLPPIGDWRPAEVRTLTVFAITALLWMTRSAPFGGWSGGLGLEGANDASVALISVVLLCMIPSGEAPEEPNGPTPRLLDWETASKIPWGMLLLFSGGLVLAAGFRESGLSDAFGARLSVLATAPAPLLVGGLCLAVTFLTEVTSNTATTALLMPILGSIAVAADVEPSLLMFPAAVSASFAFMLPVATAPNAIVYGGGVNTRQMAREGVALNLIGVVVVTVLATILL